MATSAESPNGNRLVRLRSPKIADEKHPAKSDISLYEFDASKDSFVLRSTYSINDYYAQFIFLSNEYDLVLISLGIEGAIKQYSKDGKHVKSWDLNEFLSMEEIAACGETGATLQWCESGLIDKDRFYFDGPSQRIRALKGSFSVIRAPNPKIKFSGSIDLRAAKLVRDKPTTP